MTTPFTRTEMVLKLARITKALEIYGEHDLPHLFPERVMMKYRDGLTRLLVAVQDMHVFAKCLDNAPQPDQMHVDISKRTYRGKGKGVRKDKGTKHKRRHVRTRPLPALPDAATAVAERERQEWLASRGWKE